MFRKSNIIPLCCLAAMTAGLASCNDDWKEEQYEHYISFKAPLDTEGNSVGVTTVYVPYTRHDENGNAIYGEEGLSHYELPVIVSGSTDNPSDLKVQIAHSDTLPILNMERFSTREEIWYNDMSDYAEYPSTIDIPAGQNIALLPIRFDFRNLDLADKYVLPLTVAETPGCGYLRNPRKNYATAMLRVLPYTVFSGSYQATNMKYYIVSGGIKDDEPGAMNTVQTYATGSDEVFFYAGTFNEESLLRKNFKIYAKFTPHEPGGTRGTVTLRAENPEINFVQNKIGSYNILEVDDEVESYVMRRTVIINDIDYNYTDYLTAPGTPIDYNVTGTMTLERKFNTQQPEEDQINS